MLASLIRRLGDFDRAEEAMAEAFATALETWGRDGVPQSPRAWILTTAHRRALDRVRREATASRKALPKSRKSTG